MAFMLHTMIKWFAQKYILCRNKNCHTHHSGEKGEQGFNSKMFKREGKVIRVNRFQFKTNSTNSLPLNIFEAAFSKARHSLRLPCVGLSPSLQLWFVLVVGGPAM